VGERRKEELTLARLGLGVVTRSNVFLWREAFGEGETLIQVNVALLIEGKECGLNRLRSVRKKRTIVPRGGGGWLSGKFKGGGSIIEETFRGKGETSREA